MTKKIGGYHIACISTEDGEMCEACVKKACTISKQEDDFINKIGKTAFLGHNKKGARYMVLIGIMSAISSNMINQSGGKLEFDAISKMIKIGLQTK